MSTVAIQTSKVAPKAKTNFSCELSSDDHEKMAKLSACLGLLSNTEFLKVAFHALTTIANYVQDGIELTVGASEHRFTASHEGFLPLPPELYLVLKTQSPKDSTSTRISIPLSSPERLHLADFGAKHKVTTADVTRNAITCVDKLVEILSEGDSLYRSESNGQKSQLLFPMLEIVRPRIEGQRSLPLDGNLRS